METRAKSRKNNRKNNEFGFGEESFDDYILDVTDPASDMFDNEVKDKGADDLRSQIQALQVNISQTEMEIEQDKIKLDKIFEKQAAKPKIKKSSTPHDVGTKMVESSVPTTRTDVRKVVKSSAPTKSRRSKKGQKKKSKEKKGELNLDKLRKDAKLNDVVKKQLAEYAKKGKIQKSIKYLLKITKSCIDFSSSDCESLNSEDTNSEICQKYEKKKKVKKSSNYNSSDDSMSYVRSDLIRS